MSKDRGGYFSGAGVMDRGNALPSGAKPMNGNFVGKKQQKREQVVENAENREGIFTLGQIVFKNKYVREESKKTEVPGYFATRKRNPDGTPHWSRTVNRNTRGWVRVGYGSAAALVSTFVLMNVLSDDDGSSVNTGIQGVSTEVSSTETSLPGIFIDPATGEAVTTTIAGEPTTTLAARVAIVAVAPNIMPGDTGPEVAQLQTQLIQIGCSVGPDGADGRMGPDSTAGLITFQTNAGLVPDGEYGPASSTDLGAALTAGDKTCGVGF